MEMRKLGALAMHVQVCLGHACAGVGLWIASAAFHLDTAPTELQEEVAKSNKTAFDMEMLFDLYVAAFEALGPNPRPTPLGTSWFRTEIQALNNLRVCNVQVVAPPMVNACSYGSWLPPNRYQTVQPYECYCINCVFGTSGSCQCSMV